MSAIKEGWDALNERIKELEAKLEKIEADNKISECEAEWCGKSMVFGVLEKCHRCNVATILEDVPKTMEEITYIEGTHSGEF